MDEHTKELIELMKEYFGPTGSFLLSREMKNLGFESVKDLNEVQKIALMDALLDNVFKEILSSQRLADVKKKLIPIMKFSPQTLAVIGEVLDHKG